MNRHYLHYTYSVIGALAYNVLTSRRQFSLYIMHHMLTTLYSNIHNPTVYEVLLCLLNIPLRTHTMGSKLLCNYLCLCIILFLPRIRFPPRYGVVLLVSLCHTFVLICSSILPSRHCFAVAPGGGAN